MVALSFLHVGIHIRTEKNYEKFDFSAIFEN